MLVWWEGGWGGEYCYFDFPSQFSEWHISALEMLTLVVCVKLWCKDWAGKKIQVFCANQSCVTSINSGKIKDKAMAACLRELAFASALGSFQIRAVYITSGDNRYPDLLSRVGLDKKNQLT